MSKRIFWLTNVHLSDNNINRFKKKKRKIIMGIRSKLNPLEITAVMGIGHIFFIIVLIIFIINVYV